MEEVTQARQDRLRDAAELASGCRVIHGGYPNGFTCVDKVKHAADPANRYGDEYRYELLSGAHLCMGCLLRSALDGIEFPYPYPTATRS